MKLSATAFVRSIGFLGITFGSIAAQADGFRCTGDQTGIHIQVYNHTAASEGTRTPAIMIISGPTDTATKTIATFNKDEGTLLYQGYGNYRATITDEMRDGIDGTKAIAGSQLKDLETITLDTNFSYSSHDAQEARDADHLKGVISYNRKAGGAQTENANCKRYTKN